MPLHREGGGDLPGPDAFLLAVAEGDLWLDRGDLGTAERKYREAVHVGPRCATGWVRLATLLYHHLDRADDALEIGRAALDAFPDDPDLNLVVGEILLDRAADDPAAVRPALDRLARAAAGAPESPRAAYFHAEALLLAGDRAAARSEHERAVARSPGFADGWIRLAILREEDGDRPGARTAAKAARAAAPDHPGLAGLIERLRMA